MRAHSPSGTGTGWPGATVEFLPWTLPAARRAAAGPSATTSSPSVPTAATADPAGAVSSANPAAPSTVRWSEVWNVGPSSCARHAASSGSRPAAGGAGPPSTRSAASTTVCQPVHRQRWAAERAAHRRLVDALPPGSRAARRITMPGVQNPHWLAPAATKASAQR